VTPVYELTGVSKVYRAGVRTVEADAGVDLTVADGEWVAIGGRTGSGKSTLLNLLGGLDRPASGQVRLDRRDLARLSDAELTRVRARSGSSSRRSTWCPRCPRRRTSKRRWSRYTFPVPRAAAGLPPRWTAWT
jgi:ABC-type phosphate/phosphonate transport system ATPase subunit